MLQEDKKMTRRPQTYLQLTIRRSETSEVIIKFDTAAGADGLDELPVVSKRVSEEVLPIG